jgi:hypothetical protein
VTRLGEFSPIGRLFPSGSFFENYRNSTNNWATFFRYESCVLIFTRNGMGYILGDFFTNVSGHPVPDQPTFKRRQYAGWPEGIFYRGLHAFICMLQQFAPTYIRPVDKLC